MRASDRIRRAVGDWSGGRAPLYRQLADRLFTVRDHGLIESQLPSERELAVALGTSRATVVAAYELLRAEGRITRRRGSGTYWLATPSAPAICPDPLACVQAFFAGTTHAAVHPPST